MKNLISLSTAGGGKTTKLIQRVQNIIKNGGNPDKILIISFTNASCEDIYNKSGIIAYTLHSFTYSFLNSNFTIIENITKLVEIFLPNYINLLSLGLNTVVNLVNSYFLFKNFPENLDFLSEKDQILNLEFKELINQINDEKLMHNAIFFSDIIHSFRENLEINKSDVLFKLFNTYDHFLLDEAQDMSILQLNIIYILITEIFTLENKSFFIVGDVKQSIYDFQGSLPEYYLNFIDNIKLFCLNQNSSLEIEDNNKTYRFGGQILQRINQEFVEHTSEKTTGEFNEIFLNDTDQLLVLIKEILENEKNKILLASGEKIIKESEENKISLDLLILFKKNNTIVEKVQNLLIKEGLDQKIWTQNNKIVEDLRNIMYYLQSQNQENPNLKYILARILQGCFFYMNEPDFFYFVQSDKLDLIINKSSEDPFVLDVINFLENIKNNANSASKVMEILCSRLIFSTDINLEVLRELYYESFFYGGFIDFILTIPDTIRIKKNGIKFSTVHSSKGLEAEIVIFLDFLRDDEQTFSNLSPFFFSSDPNDKTKELISAKKTQIETTKKNLLYVALTRAKSKLYHIIYNQKAKFN